MKRVFHLYKTFSPHTRGGVETYIESIINSQSKFDHQILSIGNNKLSNSKKIIFQETFNYSSDVFSIGLCKYILKKINRENDIIHLHTPWPTMEFFLCFFNNSKAICSAWIDVLL